MTAQRYPQVAAQTAMAQNVAAQTMVTRQSAQMNVQGVHVQVQNVTVRTGAAVDQVNFGNSAAVKVGSGPQPSPNRISGSSKPQATLPETAEKSGVVPHQVAVSPAPQNDVANVRAIARHDPLPITSGERGVVPQTTEVNVPQNADEQVVANLQQSRNR